MQYKTVCDAIDQLNELRRQMESDIYDKVIQDDPEITVKSMIARLIACGFDKYRIIVLLRTKETEKLKNYSLTELKDFVEKVLNELEQSPMLVG